MYNRRLMKEERPAFPKRAVITAGMPYGNKNLHFGHVGGMFVHADIFARFLRDRIGKENVIFVSGTDCYGSPILESYRKLKEAGYEGSMEDYVTANHESQKRTLSAYGISLDFFGASALGEAGEIHRKVSEEIFRTLYENKFLKKLSVAQFYDEELGVFLNGRQVIGKCPIPGCTADKAYADECSLGHQFLPSELKDPISALSGKVPTLRKVENWYFDLEECLEMMQERNEFLRKSTNTRKFQVETIEEFLKKPCVYVPRKYIGNLEELSNRLPAHKLVDEEKKNSVTFEFEDLATRDKAKEILEELGIHYTSGKTLVPFRLSGNVEWGVPLPDCEDLKDLTFWVWPESLWAPISFTLAYLKEGRSDNALHGEFEDAAEKVKLSEIEYASESMTKELADWWASDEAQVYQFIGEDNIYFYGIAQTGLFEGLRMPKGTKTGKTAVHKSEEWRPGMGNLILKSLHQTHIIANRHLLYGDTKASSSSEIKPPMADELLEHYTKDQLRMHFMSLGLSSKSVGFRPGAFLKEGEQVGPDPVCKEGNLITNVLNRLMRSCFYGVQNNHGGRIPEGEANAEIKALAEQVVLDYERFMYNHEFHRISYLLDDFIRAVNKHWVNNVKLADASGDMALRRQLIVDCFYACKVMAVLVHPLAPEGCEMFREYLNLSEELWNWDYILEPISFFVEELATHELKWLEPRVDFFKRTVM